MLLRLGDQMIIADRLPGGAPGPAYGVPGWGMPSYAGQVSLTGVAKPMPVGARYFCGDDYPQSHAQEHPCAQGNIYNSTKTAYQEAVTAHYSEEHKDLHYPVDQAKLDGEARALKVKRRKEAVERSLELNTLLRKLVEQGQLPVDGGFDVSGEILPVTRPRELPDFTEFDFPDANVADAGAEEIELDQLISIAARQGRRFLGVEIQGIAAEMFQEFLSASSDDLEMTVRLELNTRTGGHNLDDPEQLSRLEATGAVTDFEAASSGLYGEFIDARTPPPGGRVYVAPRLFWRLTNNLDRQVDIGDMRCLIATVAQPLSTFLLFELLEEFSGLFGLT